MSTTVVGLMATVTEVTSIVIDGCSRLKTQTQARLCDRTPTSGRMQKHMTTYDCCPEPKSALVLRDAHGSVLEMHSDVLNANLHLENHFNAHATLLIGSVQKPISSVGKLVRKGMPAQSLGNGSWMKRGLCRVQPEARKNSLWLRADASPSFE